MTRETYGCPFPPHAPQWCRGAGSWDHVTQHRGRWYLIRHDADGALDYTIESPDGWSVRARTMRAAMEIIAGRTFDGAAVTP